jgi:predicted PurR-regulated permease PerM
MVDRPSPTDVPTDPPPVSADASQRRALRLLAWAAIAVVLWIASPLGAGLFLGVLLGFTLQPIELRMRERGSSAQASALITVLGAMLLILVALAGFVALFVGRAVMLVDAVPRLLEPDGQLRGVAARVLGAIHVDPDVAIGEMHDQAAAIGARATSTAGDILGLAADGLLGLFFMSLAAYYVLRHWSEIVGHAERLLPFAPAHTRMFLGQFRSVGGSVLRGTVLTGLLQGALAGIGYWITGVPDPAFFGALTCVASLVPAVGTLIVWVPAGIYLIVTGHPAMGAVELAFGAIVVIGLVDYVARPLLIGRGSHIPTVLTFVGLFGGLEVFGLIGLILGPVLVTLAVAVLKTYETRSPSKAEARESAMERRR